MITESQKKNILNAFDLALGALRHEFVHANKIFPFLAATAAAQAIKETGWFTSKAFLERGNWLGISPAKNQPYVMGANGNKIRDFVEEARVKGGDPNERCFAAWAYLVVESGNYNAARAEMLAVFEVTGRPESAARAWVAGMSPVYCESDPNYSLDIITLMDQILPMLRDNNRLPRIDQPKLHTGCAS